MKKISLLAFLFTCTFINFSSAQIGYVITNKSDTIKCEVTMAWMGYPKYKIKGKESKKVTVDDIKEYQLTNDSTIYLAKKLRPNKKPEFVQVLERGKICLYGNDIQRSTGTYTSSTTTDLYVTKNIDSLIGLKINGIGYNGPSRKERKNILFNILSDNQQIANAYKTENSFTYETIRKYIKMYNQAATSK